MVIRATQFEGSHESAHGQPPIRDEPSSLAAPALEACPCVSALLVHFKESLQAKSAKFQENGAEQFLPLLQIQIPGHRGSVECTALLYHVLQQVSQPAGLARRSPCQPFQDNR
jgi:hypothetical protein